MTEDNLNKNTPMDDLTIGGNIKFIPPWGGSIGDTPSPQVGLIFGKCLFFVTRQRIDEENVPRGHPLVPQLPTPRFDARRGNIAFNIGTREGQTTTFALYGLRLSIYMSANKRIYQFSVGVGALDDPQICTLANISVKIKIYSSYPYYTIHRVRLQELCEIIFIYFRFSSRV